jgi:undecaprenyl-diphosphatase
VGIAVFTIVLAYLVLSRSGTRTTAVLGFCGALALSVLVGLSRLYLGYHWLTDVVASLGVALAVAAVAVFTDIARHGSARLRSGRPEGRIARRPAAADPSAANQSATDPSAPDAQA